MVRAYEPTQRPSAADLRRIGREVALTTGADFLLISVPEVGLSVHSHPPRSSDVVADALVRLAGQIRRGEGRS